MNPTDELLQKAIKWKPHQPQKDILADSQRNTVICAGTRFGKALSIETPILTANGWKRMADIKVGDCVFNEKGNRTKVIAETEILQNRKCYEISFSDGSQIIADAEHLWKVENYKYRKNKARNVNTESRFDILGRKKNSFSTTEVKTTKELSKNYIAGKRHNYSIKVCSPIKFSKKELPINPYMLGVWLGDGNTKGIGITVFDKQIISEIKKRDFIVKQKSRGRYSIFTKEKYKRGKGYKGISYKLKEIGVYDNKHIPDVYKFSDKSQRLELLQGLMDTDGYCDKRGYFEYTAVNKQLGQDVYELVISLGVKAYFYTNDCKLYNKYICKRYRIHWANNKPVFLLKRKLERIRKRNNPSIYRRYITEIKEVKSVPVKCIQVDCKSKLYLCGKSLIPTHNSMLCAYVALRQLLLNDNQRIWVVSLTYDMAQKIFSWVLEFAANYDKTLVSKGRVSKRPIPRLDLYETNSWLECKSADNPTSLMGEELDMAILDEAARMKPDIWERFLRARLTSRQGGSFIISCITDDTFVFGKNGLERVKNFPFKGQKRHYKAKIYGKDGFDEIDYLWQNKKMKTIKITTEGGYQLEGTFHHPIIARDTIYKKFGTWTELQDLTKNHFALIQLNQQVFGDEDKLNNGFERYKTKKAICIPNKVNKDFAYLIGLLLGDGYVGNRDITITTQDFEIKDFLRSKPFGLSFYESKDGVHFRAGSDEFIYVLKQLGYKKVRAKFKTIPESCLKWSKENICSLLSGLLDTDGCCDIRKNGKSRITFASTSIGLIKQVQMLLLDLGIISSLTKQVIKPTEKVKVSSTIHRIEICDQRAIKRFKEQIGFRIKRKAEKVKYHLKKYQRQYIKRDNCEFLWKRITKIEKSENKTYDFNIPIGHNFLSNGFISHNTPFGKNWFYNWYIKCKQAENKDGAAFHFTSKDNPYFPIEEWERLKLDLPEQIFNQEYQASFLDDAAAVFRGVKEIIGGSLKPFETGHQYVMGVDLGRFHDFTVLVILDRMNHQVVHFERFGKIDWELQKQRIMAAADNYNKPLIQIDATSITVGDAYVEDLTRAGYQIEGYKIDSNIKKRQIIEKLSLFIDQRRIAIPAELEILIDELQSFSYKLTEGGRIQYEAPTGLFDDCVLALALAVWNLFDKPMLAQTVKKEGKRIVGIGSQPSHNRSKIIKGIGI